MGKANLKFTQSGMTGGDCTAPYNVSFSRCTLRELISEILERGEWGYIDIEAPCFSRCEYKRCNVIDSPFSEEILDKEVKRVVASGGYSRMDYLVYLI